MLGLTESDFPPGAAVCSDHLKKNELSVTNDGVVDNNIPLQFCIICLASDHSKMYPMNQNYLEKAYTTMTGIAVSYIRDKIATLPCLCSECAQRLVNCDRLRDKSLRAYKALMQILQNDKVLTLQNLKSINRVEKLLMSNIAKHTFEPDHCDLYVECNEEEDSIIYSEEESSSDETKNTDMNRVNYDDFEKDSTDSDIVYLSESDDFQNDDQGINNVKKDKLTYDDTTNTAKINYDVQVNNTNNDAFSNNRDAGLTENVSQVTNEGKLDEDDDDNPDVSNVLNDDDVVLMIVGSADELKFLQNDTKDGIDNTNYHYNVLLKNKIHGNLLNRLKDENRSKNRVILRNVIFLQDSGPIEQNGEFVPGMDETNDSLRCLRVYSNKGCKNMNKAKDSKSVEHNKDFVPRIDKTDDSQKFLRVYSNKRRKNMNNAQDSKSTELNKDFVHRIDETNDRLQFLRMYSDKKCKNMNNAPTITDNNQNKVTDIEVWKENVKSNSNILCKNLNNAPSITNNNQDKVTNVEEWKENVELNSNHPDVFQETQNRCSIQNKVYQLSSKRKIPKASVPKPKIQKEPKPCVPKPKKRNNFGKLFTKTILTYEEQLAEIQRRKKTELYDAYKYKCDICFTGRWSLFTYNRHMDRHTDRYGKWECAICGIRQKTRTRLIKHVQSHGERYSCKMCEFVTCFSNKLKNHARWHSGLAFKCPHCDAKFSNQSSYFTHVRLKHPSDFVCPLCGFSFISKFGVKAHIIRSHQSEDVQNLSGPSCAQCNVRFASEASYDTHMAVSPKHVSSGTPLRNESHYKRQEGRAPPKSGPTLLCEVCGKSFQGASLLKQHMNVHTREKTYYKCDICNNSFSSQLRLGYHLYRHSSIPRRYPCSVCHRDFSSLSSRWRHMRIHNPAKRPWYTCDICNKSFTTLAAKVGHVTHVHYKVPWPKRHRPQRRARKREQGEDCSNWSDACDAQDVSVADTDDANMADTDDANMADIDDANMADADDANMADPDDANMADIDDANMADTDDANMADTDGDDANYYYYQP